MRWTRDRLEIRFPAKVREELKAEGMDPDERPTRQWLRDHGYAGIEGWARRNDMTVAEVLEDICGFNKPTRKSLGIDHPESRRLVEEWLEFEDELSNQWGENRIDDARTHIRTITEIAFEKLGTTNLLRLMGTEEEHVNLVLRLFTGLAQRLETQGSQSTYTRTLERWAEYLDLVEAIDDHKIDHARDMMGYSFARASPEHVLETSHIRECWQQAQELEEQALLVILAAAGNRRAEPTDIQVDQLRLDRADPYIVFGQERKTGPGTVPIMAGVEVIEEWLNHLESQEHWNGKWLFPSKKSRDGSRSSGWVNDTVGDIITEANVTFPDGEEPTPKHFRSWWYSRYNNARHEWLAHVEMLADEQGVSSAEVIDLHYLHDKGERDHFRKYARSHFAAAFGEEMVHGLDDVSEVREEDRDEIEQKVLDEYMNKLREEITSEDSKEDSDDESGKMMAVNDPATGAAFGAGETFEALGDRLQREWEDWMGEDGAALCPRRATVGGAAAFGILSMMGVLMASNGVYADPSAPLGIHVPSQTHAIGMVSGSTIGIGNVLWSDYRFKHDGEVLLNWEVVQAAFESRIEAVADWIQFWD